jgi:uncharacterized membrane protein
MNVDWLAVLFRWIHVLAAVVAVGGVLFQRLVLMPSVQASIDDGRRAKLHEEVARRWKGVLMACIGLLLVSGFYNFFTVSLDKAESVPVYHSLFGVKFLAALVVFFLGSALVGRARAFEGMRRNRSRWLGITAVLAVVVILVSGVLKSIG